MKLNLNMHIDSHHVLTYDAFKQCSFLLRRGTSKTRCLRLSLSPPKKSEVANNILNLKMNLEYCFFEFAKDAVQYLRHVETLIKMGEWGEVVWKLFYRKVIMSSSKHPRVSWFPALIWSFIRFNQLEQIKLISLIPSLSWIDWSIIKEKWGVHNLVCIVVIHMTKKLFLEFHPIF